MSEVFHDGEIAVQERAGVREQAAKLGPRMVAPALDANFAEFLHEMFLVIAASRDADGRLWATPLVGPRGFVEILARDRLALHATPAPGDPLEAALNSGDVPIGLLALDPMSRNRIRVNGTAIRTDAGIEVAVTETFGNCPKYIQRRRPVGLLNEGTPGSDARSATALDERQRAMVHAADTFFVASWNAEHTADASHRGGRPGFVVVSDDGTRLTYPDYAGNNMFQTLGNLSVDPAIGLLFIDDETGLTLQISGQATLVWPDEDPDRVAAWPGAQRLVEVTIEAVVQRAVGVPLRYEVVEHHRLNPAPPTA